MPRRAKPKAAPAVLRPDLPRVQITAAEVVRFARDAGAELGAPAESVAAELQAIANRYREAAAAPRLPAPSLVLDWIAEGDQMARALTGLFGDPDAVATLAPELSAHDLAALARMRAALAEARVRHLTRALTLAPGAPRTGAGDARAELRTLAARAFVPPLPAKLLQRFEAWFFGRCPWAKRGRNARIRARVAGDCVAA
jgi:hypothetical protein